MRTILRKDNCLMTVDEKTMDICVTIVKGTCEERLLALEEWRKEL